MNFNWFKLYRCQWELNSVMESFRIWWSYFDRNVKVFGIQIGFYSLALVRWIFTPQIVTKLMISVRVWWEKQRLNVRYRHMGKWSHFNSCFQFSFWIKFPLLFLKRKSYNLKLLKLVKIFFIKPNRIIVCIVFLKFFVRL